MKKIIMEQTLPLFLPTKEEFEAFVITEGYSVKTTEDKVNYLIREE